MPRYRRTHEGTTWFFTLVTARRRPLLCDDLLRPLLGQVVRDAQSRWPFQVDAWVLLPDHLHAVWTLPPEDGGYGRRWGWIKKEFSKRAAPLVGPAHPSERARARGEAGIWQRSFWEHRIRDERDYRAHCDYVHYNPVKHGYVEAPADWPFSTFRRLVRAGAYPPDWGASVEPPIPPDTGRE